MDVNTMIYNILKDVLTLVASVGLGYLTMYIKSHYSAKQVQTAESISMLVVNFAQQIAKSAGLDSQGKFETALEQAKLFAKQHGLNYTDEQWKTLLESAVNIAKKDWVEVTTEPVEPTPIAPIAPIEPQEQPAQPQA